MRPKYIDLAPGDFGEQLAPYDFVELKYDGLYAEFVGGPEGWSIHGRNGRVIRWGSEPCPECYLRGEMIIDTEWAEASEFYGCFIAWDCIYYDGVACEDYRHSRRFIYRAASAIPVLSESARFMAGQMQKVAAAASEVWGGYPGYEGLIFRSADGQRYGRMKRVVTRDYVITGYREKGPCITALFGGLYAGGTLETVVTVPVKAALEQRALAARTDTLRGLVFEAKGNSVTRYGSLRHPRQAGKGGSVKWRPDKAARECVL